MPDSTTPVTLGFNEHQIAELSKRAITPAQARAAGVLPVLTDADRPDDAPHYWTARAGYLPGLLFPVVSPTPGTARQWQLKPDTPVVLDDGEPRKYVFPKGFQPVLNAVRVVANARKIMLVEGTHQVLAASIYAPPDVSIYGISGCWSWQSGGRPTDDLLAVAGHDAYVVLDADAASNLQVYEAGVALGEDLRVHGAVLVRFAAVPGRGKEGLDDVLAKRSPAVRSKLIEIMLTDARVRPAERRPSAKAAAQAAKAQREEADPGPGAAFFDPISGGMLVKDLSEFIRGHHPCALTAEGRVAMYDRGVYGINGLAFQGAITMLLGNRFLTSHLTNTEAFTVGELYNAGAILPERVLEPLANVKNGMIDLRTGELRDHDPSFMSTAQFTVEWDPRATCPVYDRWLEQCVGAGQIDALEEAVAAVLDPSTTPTKAVFLFGPSRSGKSTFMRLLMAIVGEQHRSAVTLHQLSADHFAAADLYGKVLNVGADLSAAHVEDISAFKMLTGEDPVAANRKYGKRFTFTNRALFVFSANTLPTVGENSRAYVERMVPIHFGRTFAGHEDPTMELTMLADELPGILRRWVSAWQRRRIRGTALAGDPAVRAQFEQSSDRVAQFIAARCAVGPEHFSTATQIYEAFKSWALDEGRSTLGRNRLMERLTGVPGVQPTRRKTDKARGWTVAILPRDEWNEGPEPPPAPGVAVLNSATTPEAPPEVPPREGDKTTSYVEEPGQNGQAVAVVATSTPTVARRGDPYQQRVVVMAEGSLSEKTATTAADPGTAADLILVGMADQGYVSLCDEDHREVLVDGLWFACPQCHPGTVASDDRTV